MHCLNYHYNTNVDAVIKAERIGQYTGQIVVQGFNVAYTCAMEELAYLKHSALIDRRLGICLFLPKVFSLID